MAKLRMMKTGHGDISLAEWTDEDTGSIAVAERAFTENMRGGLAFRLFPNQPGRSEPIKSFDPWAEEILIVPAVQGG